MPVVDFLRHGETTRPDCLNGRSDPPLSDAGWSQIRQQTSGQTWTSIITSPAQRAAEPARELSGQSGVALQTDARWWEMDFGDWDGQSFEALRADPDASAALRVMRAAPHKVTPPNGESWQTFTDRIREGLLSLDDGALVVCHAGVIRAAMHVTCGMPLDTLWTFRIGYAARIRLAYDVQDDALWGEVIEIVQA
ncbi:MAG: histidine phosphatase family protein [Hyphomicrobiaceae bacterium]